MRDRRRSPIPLILAGDLARARRRRLDRRGQARAEVFGLAMIGLLLVLAYGMLAVWLWTATPSAAETAGTAAPGLHAA